MDILHAIIVLANFIIVPAIAYGSQLALGALGITLVVGVLRFSNFAHGETMAFGTMIVILMTWWFKAIGLSIHPLPTALLALPFGIIGCIIIVLLTDKFVYKFYRKTKSSPVVLVMASLGVTFIMNGLIRFIIGPGDQRFADGMRFIIKAREFREMTGLNEGLALKSTQIITVLVTVVLVSLLFWFLKLLYKRFPYMMKKFLLKYNYFI